MTIRIRSVVKEDMQHIYDMQNELTDYVVTSLGEDGSTEKTLEEVIRDSGLDPGQPQPPLFRSFIAEELLPDGSAHPVGFASVYNTYSTWEGKTLYLMLLYVRETHRKSGVGKQLFVHLARHAKETGCNRIDFHVNKNNPSTEFYKSLGAVDLTEAEEWLLYAWRNDQ